MYALEQEQELVKLAQKGRGEAVAQLYDDLFPGIYGYSRMRLPTAADAEDVVSETFFAVIHRLPDFQWREAGSFQAWVFQIARNHIANFYRRTGPGKTAPTHVQLEELVAETPPLEDAYIHLERRDYLIRKISTLSPRRKEVVLLRYFGGLRNKEIAKILDLEERTISAHLSRALAELQSILSADQEVKSNEHV